jgi:hypothetical protein
MVKGQKIMKMRMARASPKANAHKVKKKIDVTYKWLNSSAARAHVGTKVVGRELKKRGRFVFLSSEAMRKD